MSNVNMTTVYLLDVPLENDYKNTLYFTNESEQQTYFNSKKVKSYTNFSYQRKDNFIRVPDHFDNLMNCNYVMYRNTAYSNKWFYAFITEMKYVDDGRTDVYIETDCIQTWFFDFEVKASFVEREHCSDDTIGKHIVPESLESGEYICHSHITNARLDELLTDCKMVIASAIAPYDDDKVPVGGKYNGIYGGVGYFIAESKTQVQALLHSAASRGITDAITGLFMCPTFLLNEKQETVGSSLYHIVGQSNEAVQEMITIPDSKTNLGSYTPRNKKLLTNPYQYLLVSNNNGGSAIYNFEDFEPVNVEEELTGTTVKELQFALEGCICPGGSIKLIPYGYKGAAINDEESINLGKYPICSYAVDMYTNWLTQNSVNIALDVATAGVSLATGNVAGVVGGTLSIGSTLAQVHKASLQPYQARGNLNSGDVIFAAGKNTFHFYYMTIKKEFAQIIDGYFDMFGYKCHKVKVPNKAHRSRWWYTKTIDVNIDGAIPNKDMQVIKDCYNNGITFWRNANEIQDYSLSNGIAITDGAVTDID